MHLVHTSFSYTGYTSRIFFDCLHYYVKIAWCCWGDNQPYVRYLTIIIEPILSLLNIYNALRSGYPLVCHVGSFTCTPKQKIHGTLLYSLKLSRKELSGLTVCLGRNLEKRQVLQYRTLYILDLAWGRLIHAPRPYWTFGVPLQVL